LGGHQRYRTADIHVKSKTTMTLTGKKTCESGTVKTLEQGEILHEEWMEPPEGGVGGLRDIKKQDPSEAARAVSESARGLEGCETSTGRTNTEGSS